MAGTIREAIAEVRAEIATEREERREADLAIVKQIRELREPKRAPRKVAEPRKAISTKRERHACTAKHPCSRTDLRTAKRAAHHGLAKGHLAR